MQPRNILVVDDNAANRKVLRVTLEAVGRRVLEAENGVEAIAVLEHEAVDAIISDILMPRMDGYRLCHELHRHERHKSIPFIFYTSTYTSPGDEKLGLELGAQRFVRKPASTEDLLRALEAQVESPDGAVAKSSLPEIDLLTDYNERLVAKLEEKNIELEQRTQELEKAQNQLQHFVAKSPVVIYALNVQGETVAPAWVSENITALTGFAVPSVLQPDWWSEHLHPADRDRVVANTPKIFQSGQWSEEYRVRCRDGSYIWIQDDRRLIRDAAGQSREILGSWLDVSERKRVEQELRENERLLRMVMDLVPHFIFAKDAQSRHLFVNRACAAANGLTREQMVGRSDLEIVADRAQAEKFMKDDREVITTGLPKAIPQERLTDRDGHIRFLRTIKIPFSSPGSSEPAVLGVAEDITASTLAELQLATQHAVTQALAESTTVSQAAAKILQAACETLGWEVGGLWTFDRTKNQLRCVEIHHPPAAEFREFAASSRLMSFARGEGLPGRVRACGRPVWVADLAQEADPQRKALFPLLGLNTAAGFPIQLRGETLGVIELFSAQVHPPDDALEKMFAVAGSQIAQFLERKQLEEQFRQSQKMEAFGQLAGGVAHDFNNILGVIQGYVHLMTMDEGRTADDEQALKQILSSAERAASLTRQLLMFSRRQEALLKPIQLRDSIDGLAKMLRRLIGEPIKLQIHQSPDLPMIRADAGMIDQVLMNFVVNARDAMPKGGEITIRTEAVEVDPKYTAGNSEARVGPHACLSVRDTGCGIPPDVLPRIFEPFFTTKEVGKGTGLGLATVYGIVKQHQGWIEVQSQVGRGTEFRVFLPAILQTANTAESKIDTSLARRGTETILLVEDEAPLRALTRAVLERHGYRVIETASSVDALAQWEQCGAEVQLLLTDMVLPDGLTGRQLAKRLQANRPDLKVIYTTGYAVNLDGTTFKIRDGGNFLQKPYRPEHLFKAIRECLA